jgi:thymidine kinase
MHFFTLISEIKAVCHHCGLPSIILYQFINAAAYDTKITTLTDPIVIIAGIRCMLKPYTILKDLLRGAH